jgi:hypothetical protein
MHVMADTENHVQCEACGERVVVPLPHEAGPMMAREDSHSPAPGRATIYFGGKVIHQCAERRISPAGPDSADKIKLSSARLTDLTPTNERNQSPQKRPMGVRSAG